MAEVLLVEDHLAGDRFPVVLLECAPTRAFWSKALVQMGWRVPHRPPMLLCRREAAPPYRGRKCHSVVFLGSEIEVVFQTSRLVTVALEIARVMFVLRIV